MLKQICCFLQVVLYTLMVFFFFFQISDLFSSDDLWPHVLRGGISKTLFTLKLLP